MRAILAMMLVTVATNWLQAEQIRLKNGDVIFASVVSLDEKTLKLKSENFGELSVERDSVVEIRFVEPIGSSWRSVRPAPHLSLPRTDAFPSPAYAPYVPSAQPTGTLPPRIPATGPTPPLAPPPGYNPSPAATIPAAPSLFEPPSKPSTRSLQSEIMELLSNKNFEVARKRAQEMLAELESLKAGKQTAEAEGMLDECLQLLRDFISKKPSP